MSISPPFRLDRRAVFLGTLLPFLLLPQASPACGVHAQDIGFEKLWEAGGMDGPEETVWMWITDATVFHNQVFAIDVMLPVARRFGIDGAYMGDLGRSGQGPGEWERPIGAIVARDSLWIVDPLQGRWVIFGAAGEHLRTVRAVGASRPFDVLWRARNGWTVGQSAILGGATPALSEPDHHVIVWDSLGRRDTLATFHGNPIWKRVRGEDFPFMDARPGLGDDGGSWLLGDSLLVIVDGVNSRATVYSITLSGFKKLRDQPLPGSRTRLTDSDRELAISWFHRRWNIDPEETRMMEWEVPEWWSPFSLVRGDDEGCVWIRRGGPHRVDPEQGERWIRWCLATDEIREAVLPVGVEAIRFREGYMVGRRMDELGIPYLLLYRITGL